MVKTFKVGEKCGLLMFKGKNCCRIGNRNPKVCVRCQNCQDITTFLGEIQKVTCLDTILPQEEEALFIKNVAVID